MYYPQDQGAMRILWNSHTLAQNWWVNGKQLWGKFTCPEEIITMSRHELLIFDENLIHAGVGYIDLPGEEGIINWRIFTYANSHLKWRDIHPANSGNFTYAQKISPDDRQEHGSDARDFFAYVLPRVMESGGGLKL